MSYLVDDLKWGTPTIGTPSDPILWSADLSAGLSFDSSLYDIADFEGALQAAFDTWESVASVDFEQVSAGAYVDVSMAALSGSTVGLASYSYRILSGTDQITNGSIRMDSLEGWAPYGQTDLDFYAVALHEIGHILGLGHVDDRSEIMNPVIYADRLGDGDIAGARVLYGADPGDTTSPDYPGDSAPSVPEPPSPPPPALSADPIGDPEDPMLAADDGGGGAGGVIALLLAAIAGLLGFGGGGAAALAFAGEAPDDDSSCGGCGSCDACAHAHDTHDHAEIALLSDLLPVIPDPDWDGDTGRSIDGVTVPGANDEEDPYWAFL